ncbi:flagellar hook-length control protein FliK [Roseovarius salinarum]|uniref:flagellar hook-length control protein FliK n=1 Tax=Roseovarius salinarum TaxID=1981892 RepID=UPI001E41E1F5|nr:flagellar hook-length control protein FliK [Roseovarius salinarum]
MADALSPADQRMPSPLGGVKAGAPMVFQRPEVAQQIVHQFAEIIQQSGGKAVDVMLQPAELGRVTISMTLGEGTVSVNLAAERPETLELMRRHAALLAQEFRDMGYEHSSFSFSERSADQRNAHGRGEGNESHPAEAMNPLETAGGEPATRTFLHTDRMDIRL